MKKAKTQVRADRFAAASEDFEQPAFLPFDAEFMPATRKLFHETVVFVHHFGGNSNSVNWHLELMTSLGFDCVRFTLLFGQLNPTKHLPITADLKFGMRHVWTEQIEAILNALPGKKILYSFSMPSNSALMALAHRRAKDVAAWICDGGPFLQLPRCVWNLYEHNYAIKSRLLRGSLTGGSLLFYGLGFEHEVKGYMRLLPRGFPILSFRGLQDPLVPPEAIDDVLLLRKDLELETLSFEDGQHLDGLKRFAEDYRERVQKFVRQVATATP